MPNITPSVLCPACGTPNAPGFTPAPRCTACGKPLPTIVPRKFVYAARTLFVPVILILFLGIILYASPMLKAYRDAANRVAIHTS